MLDQYLDAATRMYTVLEGHLVEHVVHEPDAQQREQDFEVVLQVIRSYLK